MLIIKIIIQSLALTLTNIGAILISFGGYKVILLFRPINQRAMQTPLAILLNIILFLLLTWLIERFFSKYRLQSRSEYYLVYFAAGVWSPIILIPVHYLTQGYMTSFANIIVLWMYQVLVNIPVLAMARWLNNRLQPNIG